MFSRSFIIKNKHIRVMIDYIKLNEKLKKIIYKQTKKFIFRIY